MALVKLSVIIPARNEGPTLAEILRRVEATGLVHQIIVVDDGSTDHSPALLARLNTTAFPALCVVTHEKSQGKGAAIKSGLARVTGDVVLIQDADLEYDPADYPALLAPFSDPETHAVYGSRNLRPNPRSTQLFYWGGRLLSSLTNWLYGSRLTDEATGYKAIRATLFRQLELTETGFEFCPEVTAKLLRRGVRIREVPISYVPRTRAEGKKIRWRDGATAVWTLLKYRWQKPARATSGVAPTPSPTPGFSTER